MLIQGILTGLPDPRSLFRTKWKSMSQSSVSHLESAKKAAQENLDQHTYETVQWHFHDSTGSPFWLGKKAELKFDPLKEVKTFEDLKKFPFSKMIGCAEAPFDDGSPKASMVALPTFLKRVVRPASPRAGW